MRLTQILLKRITGPGNRGLVFTGVDAIPFSVWPRHAKRLHRRLMIEERNMFFIRHPYLTKEQEATGNRLFPEESYDEREAREMAEEKEAQFLPHASAEDIWNESLRTTDQWVQSDFVRYEKHPWHWEAGLKTTNRPPHEVLEKYRRDRNIKSNINYYKNALGIK
ncbi:unnamed protein product [Cyprideis torosa]|uniref:Uncharacterized protein n=1 Tax=Cyprideis torosa TaxID=163714 RepID=A0A7R8W960_9CRUS|nr:unnamed protein product [Cyprideis torosa]CAG0889420.1 unnamed protein product [Cyprideis torosa]